MVDDSWTSRRISARISAKVNPVDKKKRHASSPQRCIKRCTAIVPVHRLTK